MQQQQAVQKIWGWIHPSHVKIKCLKKMTYLLIAFAFSVFVEVKVVLLVALLLLLLLGYLSRAFTDEENSAAWSSTSSGHGSSCCCCRSRICFKDSRPLFKRRRRKKKKKKKKKNQNLCWVHQGEDNWNTSATVQTQDVYNTDPGDFRHTSTENLRSPDHHAGHDDHDHPCCCCCSSSSSSLTPTNQFAAKLSSQVVILKLHRNFTTTNNSTAAANGFFLPNWPVPGFRSSTILQPWEIWTLNFEEWGTFVFFLLNFFFYL